MGLVTLLSYSFDGSLSVPIDPGTLNSGTVQQAAGKLQYSVSPADNTDWYPPSSVLRRGKLPYFSVPQMLQYKIIYAESEITSFARTTPNSHMNFMLWQDERNTAWIYTHAQTTGTINAFRMVNGGWEGWGGPSLTQPVRVRFVWDRFADTVAYQYWTGAAWATIYTTQSFPGVEFTKVAWYLKSWEGGTCSATWDYILVQAEEPIRTWPGIPTDEPVTASIEEAVKIIPVGGLTGRGVRLPGAGVGDIEEPSFGTQAAPKMSVEEQVRIDQRAIYSTPLGDPQKNPSFDQTSASVEEVLRLGFTEKALASYSTTNREANLLAPKASAEEDAYQEIVDAVDFSPYTTDGDGKTHLSDVGIHHVFLYDTTGEPWATPSPGNGHYGAGRDGKWYYDGNECGPTLNGTSFGTLAGGYNHKTWMTDVEPHAVGSGVTQTAMSLVADDTIKFNSVVPGTDWSHGKLVASRQKWHLTGDFDIQVRFQNLAIAAAGSDGHCPMLRVQVDENNWVYSRRWVGGRYDGSSIINGGWQTYNFVGTGDTFGRLRIVRVGTVITTYYWNNGTSAWVLVHTTPSNSVWAKPVHVDIIVGGIGGCNITRVDVFNFAINSGTVVNTSGWSKEASSSTRGSRVDFPEKSLIVSTVTGVDIIDYSTNKLWMRFSRAANNALHSASIEVRRTTMKNGMMLISYGVGGGTICVDFTTDDIRVHATQGQTWTGAILRSFNGVYWAPAGISGRECPAGIIASRNLAGGYSGDNDNWRIPSETVRWTHVHESGGYLYKIHATFGSGIVGGIAIHRWRRWYNDGAVGSNWWSPAWAFNTEINLDFWWCWVDPVDETLYYLSGASFSGTSTLFSVPAATWKTVASGGTFTATASKAVPSTRWFSTLARGNQAVTEIKVWPSGTVWKADDNGVWSCAWPSGSFTLQIGKVSSGAPLEFMPSNAIGVGAFQFCKDDGGTLNLAVVDFVLVGGRYQTYVINMDSGLLYARGKVRRGRSATGMAPLVYGNVVG